MVKFIFMITALSSFVSASQSDCALIRDHDARMMCFASSTGSSSYCGFIKDHDAKIRCYMIAGK